jgi:hypothetical protein
MTVLAFSAALLLAATSTMANDCTVRSGPNKNALLELYTSEGCSSCPPADRWLSSLTPAAEQPRLIPVAFHVSYWDYIGWKDTFADSRFTERQRALATAARRSSVYTPQVILDGADFDGWRGTAFTKALRGVTALPAKVSLELTHSTSPGAINALVRVDAPLSMRSSPLAVVFVLTENRLGSKVTAGENRGATLHHDFVARDYASMPLGEAKEYRVRFEARPQYKPADTRIVAFVQNRATGEVLQALSSCTPG